MEVFALLRNEWAESRRLSRGQRLVAGILFIITTVLLNGLFHYLKPVEPFFFALVFVPITLLMLALFGGPIKLIVMGSLGSAAGVVVGNLL